MREMFNVIRSSNYDEEGPQGNQYFMLTHCVTSEEANSICAILNASKDRSEEDWFRVVKDGYELQVFTP